ncbi:hypothetical protein ACFYVR_21785 [Rhodococcus sp. NPDC003318]|uniref:hypothetical protein n=1 Tax=Rhodococcus sp. NPDC003318 TaxID=3364503 RepID=UPI0036B25D2C
MAHAWSLLAASSAVSIVAGAAAHLLPPGPLPAWAGASVAIIPPLCLLVAPSNSSSPGMSNRAAAAALGTSEASVR